MLFASIMKQGHQKYLLIVVIYILACLNRQAEVCMIISKKVQELEFEVIATNEKIIALSDKLQFKNGIKMNTINVSLSLQKNLSAKEAIILLINET